MFGMLTLTSVVCLPSFFSGRDKKQIDLVADFFHMLDKIRGMGSNTLIACMLSDVNC